MINWFGLLLLSFFTLVELIRGVSESQEHHTHCISIEKGIRFNSIMDLEHDNAGTFVNRAKASTKGHNLFLRTGNKRVLLIGDHFALHLNPKYDPTKFVKETELCGQKIGVSFKQPTLKNNGIVARFSAEIRSNILFVDIEGFGQHYRRKEFINLIRKNKPFTARDCWVSTWDSQDSVRTVGFIDSNGRFQ
jgi:hypothetical protein